MSEDAARVVFRADRRARPFQAQSQFVRGARQPSRTRPTLREHTVRVAIHRPGGPRAHRTGRIPEPVGVREVRFVSEHGPGVHEVWPDDHVIPARGDPPGTDTVRADHRAVRAGPAHVARLPDVHVGRALGADDPRRLPVSQHAEADRRRPQLRVRHGRHPSAGHRHAVLRLLGRAVRDEQQGRRRAALCRPAGAGRVRQQRHHPVQQLRPAARRARAERLSAGQRGRVAPGPHAAVAVPVRRGRWPGGGTRLGAEVPRRRRPVHTRPAETAHRLPGAGLHTPHEPSEPEAFNYARRRRVLLVVRCVHDSFAVISF